MPESKRNNEIQALVSMMDEPDPAVYREISRKILHYGREAVPYLEEHLLYGAEESSRNRTEALIRNINTEDIFQELSAWLSTRASDDNLLEAWMLVTKIRYTRLEEEEVMPEIESLRRDVWLEMNDNLTALEQIKVFNHVFYDIHGFSGNMDDYHNPDNSFLNRVLQTRKGNPLSLSVLYMELARGFNIPVTGVNLPEHFILAYLGETLDTETMQLHYDKPLFYIDAFSGGAVFSEKEINNFLQKLKFDPLPSFFSPCDAPQVILRMLNNLVLSYNLIDDAVMKEDIETLRNRFEKLL